MFSHCSVGSWAEQASTQQRRRLLGVWHQSLQPVLRTRCTYICENWDSSSNYGMTSVEAACFLDWDEPLNVKGIKFRKIETGASNGMLLPTLYREFVQVILDVTPLAQVLWNLCEITHCPMLQIGSFESDPSYIFYVLGFFVLGFYFVLYCFFCNSVVGWYSGSLKSKLNQPNLAVFFIKLYI